MGRRRTKLRIVPDTPARSRSLGTASGILPGLVGGIAAAAALRYYLTRRGRNNSEEVGVLTAEVHSNGHSKAKLDSLDSF